MKISTTPTIGSLQSLSITLVKKLLPGVIALAFFLGVAASAAQGRDGEDQCVQKKNNASARLFQCLVQSNSRDGGKQPAWTRGPDPTEACIRNHVQAYATAERQAALTDIECLARDELRTRQTIEAIAQSLVDGDASPAACATINHNKEHDTVTCQLTKPGESTAVNSVDLNDIVTQLAQYGVAKDTVAWFQLWGATSGLGSSQQQGGGAAGKGGYAQTIMTVADFEARGEEGSVIYFYLGQHGTHNTNSGGQGGASSFMTTEDMSQNPNSEPNSLQVVMVAGGGGGGGGANTANSCSVWTVGGAGGRGGHAFSTTLLEGIGAGNSGVSDPKSGNGGMGGNAGVGGTGRSHDGLDGYGGRGGDGGRSGLGMTSWINTGATPLTFSAGEGAAGDNLKNTSCVSGGGGGGGGWGGGGGGGYAHEGGTAGGGGGGGSFSILSTQTDTKAPDTDSVPSNPNGSSGFAQLVFDLDPGTN